MNKYKMEISSSVAQDGNIYWTVRFPAVPNCVGGGDTPEQAIAEAQENLEVYLDYLKDEGYPVPLSDTEKQEYSGKIALRISKGAHRMLAQRAKEDGVSMNTLIAGALEFYLGHRNYDDRLDDKIGQLQKYAMIDIALQTKNAEAIQEIWTAVSTEQPISVEGVRRYD